jgi:glucuronyl/N-acetylglucosaminyl transferase EXT2
VRVTVVNGAVLVAAACFLIFLGFWSPLIHIRSIPGSDTAAATSLTAVSLQSRSLDITSTTKTANTALRPLRRNATIGGTAAAQQHDSADAVHITPLYGIDYEKFTVRINTWQRQQQLKLSIQHHLSCDCVAQIQVVWCLDQGPVPEWLRNYNGNDENKDRNRVVVEEHRINSLNERFRVRITPPTRGILSADDDVIRPCIALESAFLKWTRNPDRQVGFDARTILTTAATAAPAEEAGRNLRYQYGYMSATERNNQYAISLTRYSFQHVDYLHSYMSDADWSVLSKIRASVDTNFNCEDIAMSFWISKNSLCQPPLLADYWAVKSQIKMYVPRKISGGSEHKRLRDECVEQFATLLGIHECLVPVTLYRRSMFEYGALADDWNAANGPRTDSSLRETGKTLQRWSKSKDALMRELSDLRSAASTQIWESGLIEKSDPWKKRFRGKTA